MNDGKVRVLPVHARCSEWRQIQDLSLVQIAAKVLEEPNVTDAADSSNVGYASWLLKTDFTKSMNFVSLCGLYRSR